MILCLAGFDTGRGSTFIDAMHTQGAGFDGALAAGCPWLLILEVFVNEAAGLVRAGHHAVATADTDMLVDQDDAVGLRLFDTAEIRFSVSGKSRELGMIRLPHRWIGPAGNGES